MNAALDNEQQAMHRGNNTWHVYMVQCSDGTLYTGITKDLEKRIAAHNSGRDGARYTRSRRPVTLVYAEEAASKADAARREWWIKRLPRAKKKELARDQYIMPPFISMRKT